MAAGPGRIETSVYNLETRLNLKSGLCTITILMNGKEGKITPRNPYSLRGNVLRMLATSSPFSA